MQIKAVIFDADGVVVPPWQLARHLEREYGITPAMTRPFFRGIFKQCLVGKADLMEVLPPYLSEWGWEGTAAQFVAMWLELENVVDERVVGVIRALRESGLICCLATSQEQHRAAFMRKVMGFEALFDRLYFSCELGHQKPGEGYFRHVERSLELEGQSILFWDDAPRNVAGARECGWHAEVYTSFEDFEEKLERYLPGVGGLG